MCVVLNTVILSLDGLYVEGSKTDFYLSIINTVFTLLFIAEMLLKMIALGFKGYISDRMNVFDCLIVLLSLVEVVEFTMTGKVTSEEENDAINQNTK